MARFQGWFLNAVYGLVLVVALPWLVLQSVFLGKRRSGWTEKFIGSVPTIRKTPGQDRVVWFHAVSVGEVNLLVPLLAAIRRRGLPWRCVISTSTVTGMKMARERFPDLEAFYCPLDFTWAVNRAMRRVRPDFLALTELEIWPNLINAADRHEAAVCVLNARLSENSFRGYRRIRRPLQRTLSRISLILAQTDEYRKRFSALGVPDERMIVSGSLKFDGVETSRANAKTQALVRLAGYGGETILVAGSTQSLEEEMVVGVFERVRREHPSLRLILVPRHPERFDDVARMLERRELPFVRRSELPPKGSDRAPTVLLVDSIGELAAWWGAADIAYVGGSMGSRGGQNMIEPAAYGAAVCFGPRTENFREVVSRLLAADAALVVANEAELEQNVLALLNDSKRRLRLGQRAQSVVQANQGATERAVDALIQLVAGSHAETPSRNSGRNAA